MIHYGSGGVSFARATEDEKYWYLVKNHPEVIDKFPNLFPGRVADTCVFRGKQIEQALVQCQTCQGRVLIKHDAFTCSKYSKCIPELSGQPLEDHHGCVECKSRRTPMNWSYGITTVATRGQSLLPQTMKSLANAGFDKPAIFLDGLQD